MTSDQFPPVVCVDKVATITSGTTSAEVDLQNTTLVGFITPGTLTSTTFTFTVAMETGGTFRALYDGSTALSYTVSTNRHVTVNPAIWCGVRYFKIVGDQSEGGARTIQLITRPT